VRVAGQPIDRLLATHPYYIPSIIPGGMYVGNPGDVPTIGTRAVLVSSSDQPDELVYAIVKAVFDNFAVFRQLHPALSTLEIQEMVPTASVIPIHPGALNYYREVALFQH
jgi:TRAP transporter TAXI family solute receptor